MNKRHGPYDTPTQLWPPTKTSNKQYLLKRATLKRAPWLDRSIPQLECPTICDCWRWLISYLVFVRRWALVDLALFGFVLNTIRMLNVCSIGSFGDLSRTRICHGSRLQYIPEFIDWYFGRVSRECYSFLEWERFGGQWCATVGNASQW